MKPITADARAVVQSAHLCFAATVGADGAPNLSPKGTIRVWDDEHLFFLDIASPKTRANLARDPRIVLNVVDQLSRRGYRFVGRATLHWSGEIWRAATTRVFEEDGAAYPVKAVVLVNVLEASPLISPGYAFVPEERAMRDSWRTRRRMLDADFDQHVAGAPFDPASIEPGAD